jgi:hypothetical protein
MDRLLARVPLFERRRPLVALAAAALALATLVACGGDDGLASTEDSRTAPGPLMRPGENCLRCHSANSPTKAPPWSAGGTIYPSLTADRDDGVAGVTVFLEDRTGKKVTATTNEAGNFYVREPLEAPYKVAIEFEGRRIEMPIEAPAGSCNACHSHPDPAGKAKGRIHVP